MKSKLIIAAVVLGMAGASAAYARDVTSDPDATMTSEQEFARTCGRSEWAIASLRQRPAGTVGMSTTAPGISDPTLVPLRVEMS